MRYAHIRPTEQREAVDQLGEKIAKKIQKRDNSTLPKSVSLENASDSIMGMWRNGRRTGLKIIRRKREDQSLSPLGVHIVSTRLYWADYLRSISSANPISRGTSRTNFARSSSPTNRVVSAKDLKRRNSSSSKGPLTA